MIIKKTIFAAQTLVSNNATVNKVANSHKWISQQVQPEVRQKNCKITPQATIWTLQALLSMLNVKVHDNNTTEHLVWEFFPEKNILDMVYF